jgi:hypothetical protein
VSVAIVTVAVDTTTQRLLLILAAVLVGASVGLVGALVFGAVKSVRATPARTPAVRRSAPLPPPPVRSRPEPEPRAEPDAPPLSPFGSAGMAPMPALFALDGDVRDRHRELYDAEYVKQLDRVEALRRTIGTRLALAGEPHQPSEPDPSEDLDA